MMAFVAFHQLLSKKNPHESAQMCRIMSGKEANEKRPEKWMKNNWLLEVSKARKSKSVENYEVNSEHRLEKLLVISSTT